MNSRLFCGPQTWENVVFFDLGDFSYPRILHSSAVSGRTSPTKYSQGFFGTPKGWPKNRDKTGCFLVVSCACVLFHFVSSWSPVVLTYLLVCKCVIHPCFLTFVFMFSFFAVVVFPCFYSYLSLLCSLLFIQLFLFAVFSLGVTKTQIKSQNISNFVCYLLLRCLHPHTFTWPR